jgi:hypothetical protein
MGFCYGDMHMAMMFTNTLGYDMQGRKRKARKVRDEVFKKYTPPAFQPLQATSGPVRRDEGVVYKSADDHGPISLARPESQKYTGTLVKGIATMHKSNAVPVIDQEQATDISSMRR